ncbi:RNA polymerase subunit sigma-70 [Brevibacillus ruminantium]|uniref:RNA polymerase subunit sigma-70 n=1 Tax=Brevibacillus ruminantium TaxID=2950604 RepID=A0ABY4WR99_9BACL|nr:RNA polymerase subunit sigma-70 [Brevibacillus ruminantium]USG67954.1 RNA polymerase subunit sigma-70 [Brevibacillus ruminantium]
MNGVYYSLIGVGVVSILLALLFSLARSRKEEHTAPQLGMDEIEKTLQRFVGQIKQEKKAEQEEARRVHAQLRMELSETQARLDEAEKELRALREGSQAEKASAQPPVQEDATGDVLAMRERYRRVFELQHDGLGPDDIAKRIGAGRGEIDLILSLAIPRERGDANEKD